MTVEGAVNSDPYYEPDEHGRAIEAACEPIRRFANDAGIVISDAEARYLSGRIVEHYLADRTDVVLMPRELDDAAYERVACALEVAGLDEVSIRLAKTALVAEIDRRAQIEGT